MFVLFFCSYPNDHTFCFCQSCGYSRRYLLLPRSKAVSFDLQAINERIQDLQQRYSSTAYATQKASLKNELESFLYALSGQNHSLALCPSTFAVFQFLRMLRQRLSLTTMVVPTLVRKGFFLHMSSSTNVFYCGFLYW